MLQHPLQPVLVADPGVVRSMGFKWLPSIGNWDLLLFALMGVSALVWTLASDGVRVLAGVCQALVSRGSRAWT